MAKKQADSSKAEQEQDDRTEQSSGTAQANEGLTEVKNASASGMGSIGGQDETLSAEGTNSSADDY